jgi:hypothetical protein
LDYLVLNCSTRDDKRQFDVLIDAIVIQLGFLAFLDGQQFGIRGSEQIKEQMLVGEKHKAIPKFWSIFSRLSIGCCENFSENWKVQISSSGLGGAAKSIKSSQKNPSFDPSVIK